MREQLPSRPLPSPLYFCKLHGYTVPRGWLIENRPQRPIQVKEELISIIKTWSQLQQVLQMLSMGEDSRTVCAYSQLAQRQQNFQQLLLSSSDLDVMREYSVLLEKRIEAEKKRVECELPSYRRGRGGNNIAENLKKSLLSVFKRKLPSAELAALEADCLRRHRLKSQKENVLVFFLYLHRLHLEGRIRYALIEDIREELRAKIRKYISNSLEKMQLEEGRREFHTKNIIEFQRFLQIDLDFRAPRSFAEVARQMHGFYLRKQAEFAKAVQRLARVVQSEPLLSSLFPDVPAPQPRLVVKEEQASESSPSLPPLPAFP